MKVLLVGHSSSHDLLKELLPNWGYQSIVAGHGVEALDVLQGDIEPMLLVVNWILPDMSGAELCAKLKQSKGKGLLYVLLLSELGAAGDGAAEFSQGVDDVVVQPLQADEIRRRLALGKRILEYQHSLVALTREIQEKDHALNRFAARDSLTGIASSAYFSERFAEELRRVGRLGQPLSLILLDIDYFQAYNETYGQAAGDGCLKAVADIIASSISRGGDFAARYSGGGFAVLLPNTDNLGALVIAEAIRVAVAVRNIQHVPGGINGHVTVSAGTVTVMPNKGTKPAAVVEKARQALAAAKTAGHNLVRQLPDGKSAKNT